MEPTITFASDADTIVMTGTDLAGGFVYDNDSLDAWLRLAEVNVKLNKRPNAHGTYQPDQLFTSEARIPMSGQFYGASAAAAAAARNRLGAMFADGAPITVTVTDDLGPTSRTAFLVAWEPEWMPDGIFAWELEIAAPDPRRYAPSETVATNLATASSGLVWPLGSGASYWDWGTVGTSGRVAFTNDGNTTTYPIMLVGNGGNLPNGFAITEVETGRTILYPVSTAGAVIRLDNRTQRATVTTGGDVTGNLDRKEWFAIPRGASREYQFTSLGGATGTPTLQLTAADAYLP